MLRSESQSKSKNLRITKSSMPDGSKVMAQTKKTPWPSRLVVGRGVVTPPDKKKTYVEKTSKMHYRY